MDVITAKAENLKELSRKRPFRPAAICRNCNIVVLTFAALYFFLIPFFLIIYYIADAGSNSDKIPSFAFRLHRTLSPKYEKWARERVASGSADKLDIDDISGTEWPVFGSTFYLLATDALQQAWQQDKSRARVAPNVYAAGAIEAATKLVADPNHASWVKSHWGPDYLHRENVFYRMLLINALASYQRLLGDNKYQPLLRDQVESLASELDRSPHGFLDDYPNQCYPTDIIAAIAAIQNADAVLSTDHSDFVKRSVRGFKGRYVDATGLPPYWADSKTGSIDVARGCSSQWATVWAPAIWPEYATQLYDSFEKHFWQHRCGAVGFREFPKDMAKSQWYLDVDSGPVIAGFGASASAFGIGAARANGRIDHAFPLTAEAIAISWPLPDGTLAAPRFLSNLTHAPYVGEASMLFSLTRTPAPYATITAPGQVPLIVYLSLLLYLCAALILLSPAWNAIRSRKKTKSEMTCHSEKAQAALWLVLVATGLALCLTHHFAHGAILICLAQLLPLRQTLQHHLLDSPNKQNPPNNSKRN